MIFNRLVDFKILIVGLGISGMSSAIKLKLSGANVVCWDDDEVKRKNAIKRNIKIEKEIRFLIERVEVDNITKLAIGTNNRCFLSDFCKYSKRCYSNGSKKYS